MRGIVYARDKGVILTVVHLERAQLSPGIVVMCRDYGDRIYAAFDPHQASEAEALAHLFLRHPRLVSRGYRVLRTTP